MKSWKKTKKHLIIRLWICYSLLIVVAIIISGADVALWPVSMYLTLFPIVVLATVHNILDEITPFLKDGCDEADSVPKRNAGDRD